MASNVVTMLLELPEPFAVVHATGSWCNTWNQVVAARASAGTAATRVHLIDATAQIIRNSGPQAATSRAIADRANENLGAITYYFGSKDVLVAAALTANARSLIEPVVQELRRQDIDPVLGEHRDELPAYLHGLSATQK